MSYIIGRLSEKQTLIKLPNRCQTKSGNIFPTYNKLMYCLLKFVEEELRSAERTCYSFNILLSFTNMKDSCTDNDS